MNWNPYLLGNIYLGNYVYLNYFTLTVVLVSMFLTLMTIWMFLKSGGGYSVHDTEAHSTDYGGVIKEGPAASRKAGRQRLSRRNSGYFL